MRILHVAALSMNMAAGPTYSVPSFVRAQNQIEGVTAHLLISRNVKRQSEDFFYKNELESKNEYFKFLTSYDLVIFHSTYILEHVKIARILIKEKKPYIIVPRGGFTKGAKSIKKWKKKIGDLFIFNRFFNSTNAIHFLTEMEKAESVHKTKKDFALPNGIMIPKNKTLNSNNKNYINIVFVGRIDSYHKGLDILIKAVGLIKDELKHRNAIVNLYGPDVRDSKKQLNQLIDSLRVKDLININEPVFSEEKVKVLLDADIFIQTSRFEGLPMGVLEALSFGLPCILTPGTNLSKEVDNFSAGIEVMPESLSISNGILEIIELLKQQNNLSKNAIRLAKEYSWQTIAKKSIEQYKTILENNF